MPEPKLHVHYHKRTEKRIMAFLGDLHVATITFSDTVEKWFINFQHISVDVWELDTKQECDRKVREICAEFLKGCYE